MRKEGACRDVIAHLKRTSHIWPQLPVTARRPTMVCLSCVCRRGFAFAARLPKKDWTIRLAGLSVRHYSTKTAPQLPGMEYQVSCLFSRSFLGTGSWPAS